jgi:hypothetical protein
MMRNLRRSPALYVFLNASYFHNVDSTSFLLPCINGLRNMKTVTIVHAGCTYKMKYYHDKSVWIEPIID